MRKKVIGIALLLCILFLSLFLFQKRKIRSFELIVLDARTGLPISGVSVYYAVRTYIYYGEISAILPLPSFHRLVIAKKMMTDEAGKIIIEKINYIGLKNEKILQEDLIINFDFEGEENVNNKIDLLLKRLEGYSYNDQLEYFKQYEHIDSCWIISIDNDFGDIRDYSQTAVKGTVRVIRNSKSLLKDKEIIEISM